ncbi:MAG: 4Fe-4S dicluster domain-containing protein [Proteobacteria bacterium]|nr:4Fe-4S dicluster domain-containing protein [Pseudomonadota bacterium]MBU1743033.1 4Fe-4S dicluster domain-containing protein [Pseudomonadota bacterium]
MIVPTSDFRRRVEAESKVKVGACYGCKKCSNGCPVTFAMDYHPYQVVRYVQLGLPERLENSKTIWVCASCQTCLTRCPNEVDLPRLMDYLKETVVKQGRDPAEKRTRLFHQLFLREVKARGRVFEGSLMARYMLKSGGMFGSEAFKNAKLGLAMLRRGRMKLLPAGTKDRRWIKDLKKGPGGDR